jgi:Flp pilus assembly protein TadD
MHMTLGAVYLERGRDDAAIAHFDRAAALAPASPEPLAFRGLALERLAWSDGPPESGPHTARTAEAARAYGEAWQRDPADLVSAYRFLRASRGGPGGPSVAAAAAALVAAAGRPAPAAAPPFALPTTDLFDDGMSPTPVLPLTTYAQAFLLLRRGRYDEAVTAFRQAVAAPPLDRRLTPAVAAADTSANGAMPIIGDAPLFATIGLQAHVRLDLDAAITAYERRVAHAPNDSAAHYALAEVYRARDDVDAALVEAAAAALLDRASAMPLVMIGQLHAAAGRDAEALPVLQRAISLAPDDAEARYALGRALLRLGRADEAQRELDVFRELQGKAMAEQRRQFEENFRKIEETLKATDPAGDKR